MGKSSTHQSIQSFLRQAYMLRQRSADLAVDASTRQSCIPTSRPVQHREILPVRRFPWHQPGSSSGRYAELRRLTDAGIVPGGRSAASATRFTTIVLDSSVQKDHSMAWKAVFPHFLLSPHVLDTYCLAIRIKDKGILTSRKGCSFAQQPSLATKVARLYKIRL